MKAMSSVRVLWLLNHTTLRHFELAQLSKLGMTEFFTPKFFPHDEGNLSASVDFSFDAKLKIPKDSLAILNAQNWYEDPAQEAWDIANKYFDIAVIGFFPNQIKSTVSHFKGAVVMRAFGLGKGHNYTQILYDELGVYEVEKIYKLKSRFWFGAGYDHLYECEGDFLRQRNCYLPVGLNNVSIQDKWTGEDKRILFVCPRIGTSTYYNSIYKQFIIDFSEFQFTIAGAQPIPVNDTRVIGFVSHEIHQHNMQTYRVMFYHSTEPNHVHFHPFEAIRSGMPLIFMAGGLLDKLGGVGLKGRCNSIKEAVAKMKRILEEDRSLINSIRKDQKQLLNHMTPTYCEPFFAKAYKEIIRNLSLTNQSQTTPKSKKKKIAIIIPTVYRGGSLRGAIALANALFNGAVLLKDELDIVFAYLDSPEYDMETNFTDLSSSIIRRSFNWKTIDADEARRALIYAGHSNWRPQYLEYFVPDDGVNQFLDCFLWVIISDRVEKPLLPIRPYCLMVYDYIQRYIPFLSEQEEQQFIQNAQLAIHVLVTTQFTANDVLQYAGIRPARVFKMPMLAPDFNTSQLLKTDESLLQGYFIWSTNLGKHKNHINTFMALRIYFEELSGRLQCHITGINTNQIVNYNATLQVIFNNSLILQESLQFCGELSDHLYKTKLKNSAFLCHSTLIDNGTFSVIEAAQYGIPSLSTDYPPMREINERFDLDLTWMDGTNPKHMAHQLKEMEQQYMILKEKMSKRDPKQFRHTQSEEAYYWRVIKECL